MSVRFNIGIGQIASVRGDVAHNLDLIAASVAAARERGVDHLVFPELALTGYLIDNGFADAARRLDSPDIRRLTELSRGIDLSVGFIEETPSAVFYNSALHLSHGRVVSVHRKVYLPTYGRFDERRYFGAGWDVSAFDTRCARTAMLICGDAWHLPLAYMATHDGADVLLILAASSREGLTDTTPCADAWHCMCRSYALTLSCFVVFVNHAAGDAQYDFWGGSFIAGPAGDVLAASCGDAPELLTHELDLGLLRSQRLKLPFRRDDSLAHTVQLGQRVLRSKVKRDKYYAQPCEAPSDEQTAKPR